MTNIIFIVLKTFIVVYVVVCLFVYFRQSSYVYYPSKDITTNPSNLGMMFETVHLTTDDGIKITGWFIPSKSVQQGAQISEFYTVIYCHGNGGNISEYLETAIVLRDMDYNVMMFDYRGYGESNGKPTEKGTYLDAMSVWKYLVETRRLDKSKIIIYGWSLGGAIAGWLAMNTEPYALVLESTFVSARAMARRMFPYLPIGLLCRYNYNTLEYIKRVKCPVLVAHSPDDETIPFEHGLSLFSEVKNKKHFVKLAGQHNDAGLTSTPEGRKALDEFISSYVASKG